MEITKKTEIVYKKVDDLIPYANNPRNNDEAVPFVVNSIKKFGFKVPIIIDMNNVIVAGHTRLKAAKELGLDEVPCIISNLSDEDNNAYRIADNSTSEKATWNRELLDIEIDGLSDYDMSDFGLDFKIDIDDKFESIDDEDLGDATYKAEHMLKLDKIKCILTDDEYNAFKKRFDDYVDKNGVSFGFISELLGDYDD